MNDKIDFLSDVLQCGNEGKMIKLGIKFNLVKFSDKKVMDVILRWKQCFGFLGKNDLFIGANIQKIIYCILTDCHFIKDVGGIETNLTFYDERMDGFWGFGVIDKMNRNIQIKVFNICEAMIIMDYAKYPIYKIYNLYNCKCLKDYYGSKVNFDIIIKDLSLIPMFIGNLNNLGNDYGRLKYHVSYQRQCVLLKEYMKKSIILDNKIWDAQSELFEIHAKQIKKILNI